MRKEINKFFHSICYGHTNYLTAQNAVKNLHFLIYRRSGMYVIITNQCYLEVVRTKIIMLRGPLRFQGKCKIKSLYSSYFPHEEALTFNEQ